MCRNEMRSERCEDIFHGRKSNAAFVPVLSRLLHALGLLYLSPLRALGRGSPLNC